MVKLKAKCVVLVRFHRHFQPQWSLSSYKKCICIYDESELENTDDADEKRAVGGGGGAVG